MNENDSHLLTIYQANLLKYSSYAFLRGNSRAVDILNNMIRPAQRSYTKKLSGDNPTRLIDAIIIE